MSSAFAASQEGSIILWRCPFGYEGAILGRTPDDKGRRFWIAKRRKSKAASNKEVGTGNLPNRGTESATYDSLAVSHMGFNAAGQESTRNKQNITPTKMG